MVLFSDSIPKNMGMKNFNSHLKGGRIYIKLFVGAKATQLNHYVSPTLKYNKEYKYDCAIIHAGINNILLCKKYNEINNLPGNTLEIANT